MQEIVEALRKIAETTNDLVFLIGSDLRIEYVNGAAHNFFGFNPRQLIRKPLQDLFPKNGTKKLIDGLKSLFETSCTFSSENAIWWPQPETWLETSFTPIKDDSGAVLAALGIGRDVTKRKAREELIARSRREWLRAVDTMPYLLAVVNEQYRFERVNRAMAQKLGVSVREAVGLTCHERLHGSDEPPAFCPLKDLMPNGGGGTQLLHKNHLQGDYLVSLSSLRDPGGKPIGCVYVARDMTEPEQEVAAKKRREEYMKLLLKSADYLVFIQNREGKFIFFSAVPSEQAWPWEIIGKTPHDFFEPEMASRMMERAKQVAKTRRDLSQPVDLKCNGETLHFHDKISPVRDAGGHIKAIVTISRKLAAGKPSATEMRALDDSTEALTARECEILQLIAGGHGTKEIADSLRISKRTVEAHRSRIMRKLDLHKTSELVRYAIKKKLL
jgi:PAS domain S-box-containing protein